MSIDSRNILLTDYATTWLAQFSKNDDDDRAARHLLQCLQFVPGSQVEHTLLEHIAILSADECVALYTLRKLSPAEQKSHYFGSTEEQYQQPARLEVKPGSEGRLAHMIRKLSEANSRVLDHPSVDTLRGKRVHTIVLIDDLIGSGKRAADFMRHLLRHKTICSWHSSHLINFVVLAYAATGAGIRNLARFRKIRFKLLYEVVAPSYNDFHLSPAVVKTVDAFCERFAKSKKYAHGVGEARAVIIFDYGCPNNVPQVLWNDSGRHRALFQRGAVPAELQDLFQKKSPAETAIERLGKSGEAKDVALAQRLRSLPYSEQSIHAFLNVIDRRARRNVNMLQSLSSYSGLPIASCKHLLSECKKWGLVTDENKLSEAGRHERNRLKLVAVFDGLQYPYYPKALRGQRPI